MKMGIFRMTNSITTFVNKSTSYKVFCASFETSSYRHLFHLC